MGDIESIRNDAHQICWRIIANNAIVNADSNGEHAWIKDKKKYWESMKLIGKAIGDCVTGENEFANPTEDGLIVFEGTDPKSYKRKHWNAVFLYNYINLVLTHSMYGAEDIIAICDIVEMHYENKLNNKMLKTMNDAKDDILKYDKALGLGKILDLCKNKIRSYEDTQSADEKIPHLVPGIKVIKLENGNENYFFAECIIQREYQFESSYEVYLWFNKRTKKLSYSYINKCFFDGTIITLNTNEEIKENCQYVLDLFGDLVELS